MGITIMEVDQLPQELINQLNVEKDEYSDWGDIIPAPDSPRGIRRWLIQCNEIVVGNLSARPSAYGPNHGSIAMNIGVAIAPAYRFRGFGSAAQQRLAQLLHREGYVRVEASTDVMNVAEQRALAKAGFQYEGTLRSAQLRASGQHDLHTWSHIDAHAVDVRQGGVTTTG